MKMKCEQCGQEFDPANRAGPGTKEGALVQMRYCSKGCARKAQNRRAYDRRKNGKNFRRQITDRELADLPERWENPTVDTRHYYQCVGRAWQVDVYTYTAVKAAGGLCQVYRNGYYIA